MVSSYVKAMEDKKEVQVSILDALHYLKQARDAVKPETVSNCFFHVIYNEKLKEPTDIPVIDGISREEFLEYVAVDNELETSEPVTDESIIEKIKEAAAPESESESDGEEEQAEVKIPTLSQGLSLCDDLRLLIQSRKNSYELYENLVKIEKFIRTEMATNDSINN